MPVRTPKSYEYRIIFAAKSGCPKGVLEDMLRFDGSSLVSRRADGDCYPDDHHLGPTYRSFVARGPFAPTMARWASFLVGAKLDYCERS